MRSPEKQSPQPTPHRRVTTKKKAKLEPRTVLLVHDGAKEQSALATAIQNAGHICFKASRYETAIDILRDGTTEIVICDCSIHGVAPSDFLDQHVKPKNIPFKLISGRASQFNGDWRHLEYRKSLPAPVIDLRDELAKGCPKILAAIAHATVKTLHDLQPPEEFTRPVIRPKTSRRAPAKRR